GGVEQALVVLLRRPADGVEQLELLGRPDRVAVLLELDAGAAGQHLQRLGKADARVLLNKTDDVAVFTTGPPGVAVAGRVDGEGGPRVVVEGAQALEGGAGRAQGNILADDIDDVVGLFYLLDPVVRQGPPVVATIPGPRPGATA